MRKSSSTSATIVAELEAFTLRYSYFPAGGDTAFVLALWVAATYLWERFDAFPYLTITSDTKRSGKTRLSEVLSFVSRNPMNFAAATAAALFRSIRDNKPTVFIDEAETLSNGAAGPLRSVLNVGYRRGQTVTRAGVGAGAPVEEWPVYCPKVFILIGDVYDTLRDRSIIVRMHRGPAPVRFLYEVAKADGNALGATLTRLFAEPLPAGVEVDTDAPTNPTPLALSVYDAYAAATTLDFLSDRDAEIWAPLFAVASALCPARLDELTRIAVDMATEKTVKVRKHTAVEMEAAEKDATDGEYAERLLADVMYIIGDAKGVHTAAALPALFAIPTAPWRKFRGAGLTVHDFSNLLNRFGVKPKLLRLGKNVARGYVRADIEAALERNGNG